MLGPIIREKTRAWLLSDACTVRGILAYIRERGALREPQIEAIETYLFLKIAGENKPLWRLFAEGFFSPELDLSRLNVNEAARNFLSARPDARALYAFASHQENGKPRLPELEGLIVESPGAPDYEAIIRSLFYGVAYPDYLMSLPMGAGKTYLMAAFIYLDLYFAEAEPENPAFAHNFLVLAPSGLKSSIVPSLRSIEDFAPDWVIAEPAASRLKGLLRFDVLDEAKSGKRSNRARNPNAQKVSACLPDPFGQVFVVNAEKVILDRLELSDQERILESDEDERDRYANELRNLIGKIPNLSILIEEVHHAAKDDVKLRQVVNRWHAPRLTPRGAGTGSLAPRGAGTGSLAPRGAGTGGNITTVLGFSGTPYLASPEKIEVGEGLSFKLSQITNTVYYYPLKTAIEQFLKKPTVKVGENLGRLEIIRRGVADFRERYEGTVYADGTIPKLALYCSSIEVLEETVYPFLTGDLGVPPDEVLKYHKGNKAHAIPRENEAEFRALDTPVSKKRYVLLVQIGKEGWDCRSLTGVVLSQVGDSPRNMVLQTSCRCLRQVNPDDPTETALIWLNEGNAKLLNAQLKQEQNTSIAELNALSKDGGLPEVMRHARTEHLKLPPVLFCELEVTYQALEEEADADTRAKLRAVNPQRTAALVRTGTLDDVSGGATQVVGATGTEEASYRGWLFELSKASFGLIALADLHPYDAELRRIFSAITFEAGGARFHNALYDRYEVNRAVRLAFSPRRRLTTTAEVVPKEASLLLVDKLSAVKAHDKLYPSPEDCAKILDLDASGAPVEQDPSELEAAFKVAKAALDAQGFGHMLSFDVFKANRDVSKTVRHKDRTFHYLPYDFRQSKLELDMLQEALCLTDIKERGLELYFNGERGLTEFVISCYVCEGGFWKNVGRYTPDFLLIERREGAIHKAMILETKGAGYSNDPVFLKKKQYVEGEFLRQNNDHFGYARFDYLYLQDSASMAENLNKLSDEVRRFFGGAP